jgi:hypothetical protein
MSESRAAGFLAATGAGAAAPRNMPKSPPLASSPSSLSRTEAADAFPAEAALLLGPALALALEALGGTAGGAGARISTLEDASTAAVAGPAPDRGSTRPPEAAA